MNELLIGLVGAVLATNQPQAVSNLIQQQTGASVEVVNPNDPAEAELHQLMIDDDKALADVDQWIRDNNDFAAKGAGESKEDLNKRILARFDIVRKGYEDFLSRHPDHARGHLAYGSFLNDIGDEDAAAAQNEKAAQLDPKNPAAWNNLANYYGEHGPLTNAFIDYAKAIELNPNEPVYYQNFGTLVYLYRKDAKEFYNINEQQVFDKSLELYRKAVQLDPDNFPLVTDYAQSYYGIRPLRTNDALEAWTNALAVAHNDTEREGVFIHLARIKMAIGRFAETRAHLDAVTNSVYHEVRQRLERNLAARESGATNLTVNTTAPDADNPPPTVAETPVNVEIVSNNVAVMQTNPVTAMTNETIVPTNEMPASTNESVVPASDVPALTNVEFVVTNSPVARTNPADFFLMTPPTLRPPPTSPP